MSDETPNAETFPAPEPAPADPGSSAAPVAVMEPPNLKGPHAGETNETHRVAEDRSRKEFERKYAYWTWCPSQGRLYGSGVFPGGEIILSPMTTSEEKILQQSGKDRMEIVDDLVQRCIVKCPVAYEDLLIPDMFYMLLVIRNITYGSDYKFRLECAKCSLEYQQALEIPKGLKLRCLTEDDEGEPWSVTLPREGDVIQYRMLRVKDETDIRRWGREAYQRSVQTGDPAYVYRIAKHIVSINGQELDAVKRLDYAEEMIGSDSLALRRAIEKRDFGIKLMLDAKCPSCGHDAKARLPFDREFFRPSDGEDGE